MDNGQLNVSATAQALGSGGISGGFRLVALAGNLFSVYIGTSGVTVGTGYELQAGQEFNFDGWGSPPSDLSQIFVICPALGLLTAPKIAWIKQA